ncbi:hypothetical protein ACTXT7_009685 [Hymenolepis weldensis]
MGCNKTTDVNFYKTCQQPVDHLSLIHLLVDCSQKPPAYHLLIDISVLINQLPSADVQDQTEIYFMGWALNVSPVEFMCRGLPSQLAVNIPAAWRSDTALCKFKNMHMNVTVIIPERRHSSKP